MKAIGHHGADNTGRCPADFDEVRLIERARFGEGPAIEVLLERHRDWIVRRCVRWVRNRADAEDAAQEVLVRACAGLRGLKQRARFHAWLARITDNQCKTFLARRQWITVEHIERLIDLQDSASHFEELEGIREEVRLTLDEIQVESRQVLYLRFFQELSLDQIAGRLDITLSAAKMRLYRAQDRFAARYEALKT